MNEDRTVPEKDEGKKEKKPMSKKKKIILIVSLSLAAAALIAAGVIVWFNVNGSERAFEQHYNDRMALFREENKTAGDIDVVFLGDSITELYDVNNRYPGYKVLNRGIGGDTTDGVLKRLDVSVYDVSPKAVVMLIGVNNIYKMMDNYEQILQSLRDNAPDTKIVLQSLTPMSGSLAIRNAKAVDNNKEIEALAEKYGFTYVDVYSALADGETGEALDGCTTDGLHLSDKGYEIVTEKLTAVLAELIGRQKNIFEQHYDDLTARFLEENKTAKDIDVVFLGDSITELCDVNKWYPEYKVLNRGIGGDTTDGVLKRLELSVYDVCPKAVVMLIGVNNVDTMMENYEQILQSFRDNAPDTKIVLQSLTPMSGSFAARNAKAAENNRSIAALAEKYGFTYVDVYPALSDGETGEALDGYTTDGLHLSDKGYEIATARINAALAALLSQE